MHLVRIQNGTVTLIPVAGKQRVLDPMQEVIRLRIEVGNLVSTLRGDSFIRCKRSAGEDFLYISSQPTEHMFNTPIAFLLQKLARFLEMRFSIDLRPADLSLEIPSGESVPNGYTLLDLVFVFFWARCCLGQVPGGAPFSQRRLNRQLHVQIGCKLGIRAVKTN